MGPLEKEQKMAERSPRGRELVLRDTSKIRGEDWNHQEAAEDSQASPVRRSGVISIVMIPQPELLVPIKESALCQEAALKKLKAVLSQFYPFVVPFGAYKAASHRSFSLEAMLPGNTVKSASIRFPGKQASTLVKTRSSHSFSLRRETHFVHLFLASP